MSKRAKQTIDVIVDDPKWKKLGRDLPGRIECVVSRVLAQEKAKGGLTLLLTDDVHLKELNAVFRGKKKPTNVLSFPAQESAAHYLGDVAIALGVVTREAKAAKKSPADHTLHLAVHGTLHLLGHDHMTPREASRMERLEAQILAEFGIADPYAASMQTGKPAKRRAKTHG
jgi:probable rRNA maturation factor